ncbi:hypothetical protein SAMN00120144_4201 [Hymenobacter roseosalivarius DSM 11622]|uniref:Uncharacterized protein n=1 Tax=Hymenobacter roseosalivarius DSM 11622 TaxID=645990 RepID=A0A1W1UIK4_9BACT|nr:hypothetical protein SAMN00120144_4201 [Hymenobacter roseosalivarius DSM 11622]
MLRLLPFLALCYLLFIPASTKQDVGFSLQRGEK